MAGLERRLERLEEQMHPAHLSYEEWPLVEQIEDAFCYVKLHARWGSRVACTAQQLRALGLLVAHWENPDTPLEDLSPVGLDDFPDEVKEHVSRLDPRAQPERDAWLREEAGYYVRTIEELPARLAEVQEQQQARAEESRRRDRELIAHNRALVGLPPLESDE
jgi:hypothetical protein